MEALARSGSMSSGWRRPSPGRGGWAPERLNAPRTARPALAASPVRPPSAAPPTVPEVMPCPQAMAPLKVKGLGTCSTAVNSQCRRSTPAAGPRQVARIAPVVPGEKVVDPTVETAEATIMMTAISSPAQEETKTAPTSCRPVRLNSLPSSPGARERATAANRPTTMKATMSLEASWSMASISRMAPSMRDPAR